MKENTKNSVVNQRTSDSPKKKKRNKNKNKNKPAENQTAQTDNKIKTQVTDKIEMAAAKKLKNKLKKHKKPIGQLNLGKDKQMNKPQKGT